MLAVEAEWQGHEVLVTFYLQLGSRESWILKLGPLSQY